MMKIERALKLALEAIAKEKRPLAFEYNVIRIYGKDAYSGNSGMNRYKRYLQLTEAEETILEYMETEKQVRMLDPVPRPRQPAAEAVVQEIQEGRIYASADKELGTGGSVEI
ncbi:MAG: hypothetical protein ACYTFW_26155 [Planctomycetota bacterium]